jgi:hypothetical protein
MSQTLVFMSNAVEVIESSVIVDFLMTFSATLPKIVSSKLLGHSVSHMFMATKEGDQVWKSIRRHLQPGAQRLSGICRIFGSGGNRLHFVESGQRHRGKKSCG